MILDKLQDNPEEAIDNEVVVCFNEGDVAPMSMGCPEFVIPNEVLAGIRK